MRGKVTIKKLKKGIQKNVCQKKRSKDILLENLKKKCNIDIDSWESSAVDRKSIVGDGTTIFESKRSAEVEEKKYREGQQQPGFHLPCGTTCLQCRRIFQAEIGLISNLGVHNPS